MGQVAKPGPGPARQDPSVQSGGEGEAPAKRRRKVLACMHAQSLLTLNLTLTRTDITDCVHLGANGYS